MVWLKNERIRLKLSHDQVAAVVDMPSDSLGSNFGRIRLRIICRQRIHCSRFKMTPVEVELVSEIDNSNGSSTKARKP